VITNAEAPVLLSNGGLGKGGVSAKGGQWDFLKAEKNARGRGEESVGRRKPTA